MVFINTNRFWSHSILYIHHKYIHHIFVQEESHEAKRGEQQKILGEWWTTC